MTPKPPETPSIKSWAADDQPRYKLRTKGAQALSDSELLALLIGSGSRSESAVDLCKRILRSVDTDLERLARLRLSDLMKFNGIGDAKAITISAALELGRRRQSPDISQKVIVKDSYAAFEVIAPIIGDKNHEEFWVLYLDRGSAVIDRSLIASGGISHLAVDIKRIFSRALEVMASSLVLCHNHPSGRVQPSKQDQVLTSKIVRGAKLLDLHVVDHLIVCGRRYFSFADENILYLTE